jgi:uncharacterized membrane protein affecting hemolysin expression
MIDKAFGMREVASQMTQEPMANIAASMIMSAETDEEKKMAINTFGQTLVGLMAYAMSELLLSAEDFQALTATIDELTAIEQNGEDN